MYKGRSKLLPVVLVVVVAIVAIIALVSVGRAILNRGDQTVAEDNPAERSLLVSEIDRSVRMTVRGPIIADENFNSYEITVSPTERIISTYEGYQDRTITTERFPNSTAGYEEFVYALSKLNFSNVAPSAETLDDVRGVCASGRLYTFDTLQAQSTITSAWISSCRGNDGSFRGDAVSVRDLFHRQIPDSSSYLSDLNL